MTLIIDGHNLIPKIHGLDLRQMDDEEKLAELLQAYARLRRKQVDVYFDGAPSGFSGPRAFGIIQAHFVPKGMTADAAIRKRLVELGRAARNVTVVTSDRMVQAEARRMGASVISSEIFARDLEKAWEEDAARAITPEKAKKSHSEKKDQPVRLGPKVPPKEVDEWLKIFDEKKPPDKKKG